MKKKQSIVDEEVKCGGEANKRKNIKSSPCDELEKVLIEWSEGMMRSSNLPINGTLMKVKAIRVAEKLTSRLQTDGWAGLRSVMGSCIKIFAGKVLNVDTDTVKIILFLM
jgi:hypothetical protein